MANNETKVCQNCKVQFIIEPEDFDFYKKFDVPPPTWCPECRKVRRLAWRNERALYKRPCSLCGKAGIAMYAADVPFPVYCKECWYSDAWDAETYGRPYDFSKPFFAQFDELSRVVPRLALWQRNVVNSDYSNMIGECKNVYLSSSVVLGSENVFYSKSIDASFNIFDSFLLAGSDGCYENIDGEKNYNSHYLTISRNCIDSRFLVDCVNCKNCVLCSNLRNKEYCIRNTQYSKTEYDAALAKMNFGSRTANTAFLREFRDMRTAALYRYANVLKSPDSTGNNLSNVRNGKYCFDIYNTENAKYCYRAFSLKDCMDVDFAVTSELIYEYTTGALNDYNVKFSYSAMDAVRNAEYTESCNASTNLFGCIGARNKENMILNKTYTKAEFTALRERIIAHMNEAPFQGANGRVYRYGEYFPMEIAPFAYNESMAQDIVPLSKAEALQRGYRWREPDVKAHAVTMPTGSIPDDIASTDDSILNEVFGCVDDGACNHQCYRAFRLTPDELQFYRKHSIPLPEKCPNCRYYERTAQVPPQKLWTRQCMCDGITRKNTAEHQHHASGRCPNTFETPFAPDRKEIVYCEQCYQAEIV